MKRIITFTIILMALTACSVFQVEKTESAGTAMPPNMPNPAAVDCEIGKQLVIQTAADGSQSSECVFPDGSGGYMPPESTEEITNWWGVIKSTAPGAQYDDYFERRDLGQIIYFGIDSMDLAVQAQIIALRNSGKIVHLYGTLFSNVPDYNGSPVQVRRAHRPAYFPAGEK
jgi:putative hemolysin